MTDSIECLLPVGSCTLGKEAEGKEGAGRKCEQRVNGRQEMAQKLVMATSELKGRVSTGIHRIWLGRIRFFCCSYYGFVFGDVLFTWS